MAERTPERLVRLLGLVAFLDRHPGVGVGEVAAQFDLSPVQVLRDVDTLWMSGTPGYFPDDLIDFDADSLDSGVLRLTQSRGMARALRLGTREAVALVAALRALDASIGDALDDRERAVLTSTPPHASEVRCGSVPARWWKRARRSARPPVAPPPCHCCRWRRTSMPRCGSACACPSTPTGSPTRAA